MKLLSDINQALEQTETVQEFVIRRKEEFPEAIAELKGLKRLWIQDCTFETLPQIIGELEQLEELRVYKTPLKTLPDSLAQLTNLTYLSIEEGALHTLPDLGTLQRLETLALVKNKLQELPISIGQCAALKACYLGYNQLETIPEEWAALPIEIFNIEHNNIRQYPTALAGWTALDSLNLGYNQLTNFPDIFSAYTVLRHLWLNDNQLSRLPESLNQVRTLSTLSIGGNPFVEAPLAVIYLDNLWTCLIKDTPLDDHLKQNLHTFYQAVSAAQSPIEYRKVLYEILASTTDNPTWTLRELAEGIRFPMEVIRQKATAYLTQRIEEKWAKQAPQKGLNIAIYGNIPTDKNTLRTQFKKLQLQYRSHVNEQTDYVVVGGTVTKIKGWDREGLLFITYTNLQDLMNRLASS